MAKFKETSYGAAIILTVVCLVTVTALVFTNGVTAPLIKAAALKTAEAARSAVLPEATGFTKLDKELPQNVGAAYQANNDVGYVFEINETGFGGPMQFVIGMNSNSEITGISVLEHTETPGLGSKVTEQSYLEKFFSGASPSGIDNVTSATVTSLTLKRAIQAASAAFESVTGTAVDGETSASTDTETATTGDEEVSTDTETAATVEAGATAETDTTDQLEPEGSGAGIDFTAEDTSKEAN